VELRLDYFTKIKFQEIKLLRQNCKSKIIFTLRKKSQGGFFNGNEPQRLQLIENLIAIKPDYFDLECDLPVDFVKKIHRANPTVKLIASYHNFKETPKDLSDILEKMQCPEFYGYKIATQANSVLDTMRMLIFMQQNKAIKITGICMGKLGEASRILAPIVNNYFNFTYIKPNKPAAPGQLDIKTLMDLYNYKKLNSKTAIYALLGDPVEHSISHIFHNNVLQNLGENAVYIKLRLQPTELKSFFKYAKNLPFKGFSVTMPLKEKILPHLDKLSEEAAIIKAVNTIAAQAGKYKGYNTDGIGALDAIAKKTPIKNKKIVILGAGGTAKAIAFIALKRGAEVIILNRTIERAQKIAKAFNCTAHGLDYAAQLSQENYDILINATSVGMNSATQDLLLIPTNAIIPNTIVLDMVYAKNPTQLLKIAATKNCLCISGKEAFISQAKLQIIIWFNQHIRRKK
jgi:3-dehydroquinate dehydratase/shikimate dehydrogenase